MNGYFTADALKRQFSIIYSVTAIRLCFLKLIFAPQDDMTNSTVVVCCKNYRFVDKLNLSTGECL